jgi:hypothetical protein
MEMYVWIGRSLYSVWESDSTQPDNVSEELIVILSVAEG